MFCCSKISFAQSTESRLVRPLISVVIGTATTTISSAISISTRLKNRFPAKVLRPCNHSCRFCPLLHHGRTIYVNRFGPPGLSLALRGGYLGVRHCRVAAALFVC